MRNNIRESLQNARLFDAKIISLSPEQRHQIEAQRTDAKIKERYEQLVAKFKPQDEVRARHILVNTEAEAEDIIEQLKDGTDFAKLAEEKSKDAGSAKHGGDLGYFAHDAMLKPFADAAFAMKVGEISETPVKTTYGYHIIKIEDRRKSSFPPLAVVKSRIAAQLLEEVSKSQGWYSAFEKYTSSNNAAYNEFIYNVRKRDAVRLQEHQRSMMNMATAMNVMAGGMGSMANSYQASANAYGNAAATPTYDAQANANYWQRQGQIDQQNMQSLQSSQNYQPSAPSGIGQGATGWDGGTYVPVNPSMSPGLAPNGYAQ